MASQAQLAKIRKGVAAWNRWRKSNPQHKLDFSHADLGGANLNDALLNNANLQRANLRGAHLRNANLSSADLIEADLSEAHLEGAHLEGSHLKGANLRKANLRGADLYKANLKEADLRGANLHGAFLREASLREAFLSGTDLSEANLEGANLRQANLVRTNLERANLTACTIYGISAWEVDLTEATQIGLIVTRPDQPTITVDNLEVAQFIHLLLSNEKIRQVIDTITSKVVLILGRFTPERKAVLDAIREELRRRGWLPVLFDFEGPISRDVTETVSTLAHMARFIIADITDAKSIPQELQAIVPHLPSVPIQPLLEGAATEYSMFEHFKRYPWVLPVYCYEDQATLLASLGDSIITPAEEKAKKLMLRI